MELQGDEAELRGEVAGGARIGDKGSPAAGGVLWGESVGIVVGHSSDLGSWMPRR